MGETREERREEDLLAKGSRVSNPNPRAMSDLLYLFQLIL